MEKSVFIEKLENEISQKIQGIEWIYTIEESDAEFFSITCILIVKTKEGFVSVGGYSFCSDANDPINTILDPFDYTGDGFYNTGLRLEHQGYITDLLWLYFLEYAYQEKKPVGDYVLIEKMI